jgi:hypothetical protein
MKLEMKVVLFVNKDKLIVKKNNRTTKRELLELETT